jgi:cell division protein FtsW
MTTRKISYDQTLILIVLALVGFGLVMVLSASSIHSKEIYGSSTGIFTRQLSAVLIGLVLLLGAMRLDYHVFQHRAIILSLLLLILALLTLVLLEPGANGVRRWIRLGPLGFQPSELAKLVVILYTSYYVVRRGGSIKRIDQALIVYLAILGAVVVMVLVEPDFGTSTSLVLTASVLLFLAGLRVRYYLGAFLLFAPLFYFLVLRVPYRRERILAFLDPTADPHGSGYQILQSLTAVGSGGLTGAGLAQGTQKLFYLPEPHTDFIFAVIGEEVGLLGCLLVLFLFTVLLWRGVRISLHADSVFGTYLGLGIVLMIVFQAFFNMSVVLSLCPTKGIPLPFISVGGSSMMVNLIAIGILLNISRQARPEGLAEITT